MNDSVPRLTVHLPPHTHKYCVPCNADFLNVSGLTVNSNKEEGVFDTTISHRRVKYTSHYKTNRPR